MINYYNILGLELYANEKDIYTAYREKIGQFNNLPFLTKTMIDEIKMIKSAIYILGDEYKKNKYDEKYKRYKDYEATNRQVDGTKICDRLFSIRFN
jgi:DnaJ-class molecular chaperone